MKSIESGARRDCKLTRRLFKAAVKACREYQEERDCLAELAEAFFPNRVKALKMARIKMQRVLKDLTACNPKRPKKDAFQRFLEHASKVVSTWPAWKQNVLEISSARNKECFDPHPNYFD